ncbi:MAG: peptidylprolyl isomerase [Kofleriaceae bacterium]
MRALVWIVIAGCSSSQPVEPLVGPPAPMAAPRASADDVVVATVNGQPVWGSCVAIQAKRGATRQAALAQCVDFELLAQRAIAYAGTSEVRTATHTAMVNELVTTAYEQGFTQPAQFGPFWDRAYKQGIFHIRHENYRASSYVRITVPDHAPAEVEAAAKRQAEQIAAALAHETGIMNQNLVALAQAAAPDAKLDHEDVPAYRAGALDPGYAKALFGLKELGRATSAVRTKWGWDVIAWTDDVPETSPSEAEVTAALLPDAKRAYFGHWVDDLAKQLGVHVALDRDNIAKLEDLP